MINPRKVCVSVCLMMAALAMSLSAFAREPGDELDLAGTVLEVGGAAAMGGGGYVRDIADAMAEVARSEHEADPLNPKKLGKLLKYERRASRAERVGRAGFTGFMIGAGELVVGKLIGASSEVSDSLEKIKRPVRSESRAETTDAEKLAEGRAPL